ncbi:MAG: glycosyltransferase family 2 protein [Chitinophagales bacterium]|nr:glycosyltransferase family 2 protein [Chitinophagales bacterium]MDW8418664.1 glycosyltransferase family 2 protein [Chitinophagales bacterium]
MISVVVPTYRGANTLPELITRLHKFFTSHNYTYEIVVVNDSSPDNTKDVLKELKLKFSNLKVINLMRNYGQHNAILCGFKHAKGDVVITMDDDLQNPPEEIQKLLQGIEMGFDLVIGAYGEKKHNQLRNMGGSLIDNIQRYIFKLPDDFQLTSFRAIRRSVIDVVNQMSVPYPYVTAMLLSQTTNYVNVDVVHLARQQGTSNYNLGRSLNLAMNLIFNYSSLPLYAVSLILLISLLTSVAFASYLLISALFFYDYKMGWVSTMLVVSFFSTLNLFTLLIFGLYLARVYQLTMRAKSSYVISEIHE